MDLSASFFLSLIAPYREVMFLANTSGDAPLHQRMVAEVVPPQPRSQGIGAGGAKNVGGGSHV